MMKMDFNSDRESTWKNFRDLGNDPHLEMTLLYEMAFHMGIQSHIPRVIFAGQKSAGKSTLVEMCLNFKKVCHSAKDRATVCPVI